MTMLLVMICSLLKSMPLVFGFHAEFNMITMISTIDEPCWLADTYTILLLFSILAVRWYFAMHPPRLYSWNSGVWPSLMQSDAADMAESHKKLDCLQML